MAEEAGKASRIEKFDSTDFGFWIGMAIGWVRTWFLYARTRPAGLNPLPELAPINKRVFFPTQNPPCGLHGPHLSCPTPNHNTNTNADIKNTSFRFMNLPFKITNTNTNTNTVF